MCARILTALALLIICAPLIIWGNAWHFALLLNVFFFVAAWEWLALLKSTLFACFSYASLLIGLLYLSDYFVVAYHLSANIFLLPAVVFWLFFSWVLLKKKIYLLNKITLPVLGIILFIADWHALKLAKAQGTWFLFSVFLVVWLADSGAYFFGRYLGKHALAPNISPKKTWEGFIGGAFFVLIAMNILYFFAPRPTLISELMQRYNVIQVFIFIAVLIVYSAIGDLFESLLKRQAQIKDSGRILPGHGGVLDRVDALIPVFPIALFLL